jgi:nucleotide-binding universal stress UspA family protein
MAVQPLARRRTPAVSLGYRRIVVPVLHGPASERAVEVACRLAAERHASVTVVTVVEVPPMLPLDARMDDEEDEARRVQKRAEAIADAYGVTVVLRRIRARHAGPAILEELGRGDVELVVLGAFRRNRLGRRASPFGRTVQQVLRGARCRVLVVAPPVS